MKLQLTEYLENRISQNLWLDDSHMDIFHSIIHEYGYSPQGTWKVQLPDTIDEIPANVEHIQILFSGAPNTIGHWVCSYYDRKSIYIYIYTIL